MAVSQPLPNHTCNDKPNGDIQQSRGISDCIISENNTFSHNLFSKLLLCGGGSIMYVRISLGQCFSALFLQGTTVRLHFMSSATSPGANTQKHKHMRWTETKSRRILIFFYSIPFHSIPFLFKFWDWHTKLSLWPNNGLGPKVWKSLAWGTYLGTELLSQRVWTSSTLLDIAQFLPK